MKIPYGWVREMVDLDLTVEQAADRLINAGVDVASVTPIAPDLRGVVVGEIEAIEREVGESHGHRVVLCRVSTGSARYPVVCGAPNAAVGVRAPFAPPGATLPGGRAIGVAKIRGVQDLQNNIMTLPTSQGDDDIRSAMYSRITNSTSFENEPIDRAPSFRIVVDHGSVTLYGFVQSEIERRELESIARYTNGVLRVTNNLKTRTKLR